MFADPSADEGKADSSAHELGYRGAGPGDVREGYSGSCGQYEPLGERRVQEEQGNGGLRVGPVCVLGGGGGNGVFTSQV